MVEPARHNRVIRDPMSSARRSAATTKTRPASLRHSSRPLLAVFGLALALRFLHVWQIRSAPFFTTLLGDSKAYDTWALRIANGDWLGSEVFYQAPLYPYFLGILYSLVGRDLLLVRLVQGVIGSMGCVVLALAGARWFSRPVGLAAGAGLALYAPMIFADALIQKSVLDVVLMSTTVWLAGIAVRTDTTSRSDGALSSRAIGSEPAVPSSGQRLGRSGIAWFAAGTSLGLLSLTRENSLALAAAIIPWLLLRRRAGRQRLLNAAMVVAGLGLVLVPVALRNAVVGGAFQLTTAQLGPNFYIGNNPSADGTYAALRFGRGDPEYEQQDATALAERALGRALSPGEVSAYWTSRAFEYIRTQPADWVALTARKVALLVNATEMLDTESQQTHAEYSLVLATLGQVAHFGFLAPAALFGVWVTWARRRELALLYLLLVTYAASVVLFYVFARYRYPLVPVLMLFAAAGMIEARRFFREAGARRLAAALAAVAGLAAASRWPLLSPDLMRAITENNLATALREAGRLEEAEAHYRRALAISPHYAAAHSNLGALLRATGRVEEAISHYREALRLQPDHPTARYNLGNALLAEGRPLEAAEQFRQVVAEQPDSVEAHNNLGVALATAGQLEAAARAFRAALALDPASADAHRNLANVLDEMGHKEEAMRHFEHALTANPSFFEGHYDFGRALLAWGDLSRAVSHLRRAVALNPRSADAHNNLGVAFASAGQLEAAIEHFERALALQPDHEEARRNLVSARAARRR